MPRKTMRFRLIISVSAGLHRLRIRTNTSAPFTVSDACTSFNEGNARDYLINVTHETYAWTPTTFLASSTERRVFPTNMTTSQTYTVTANNAITGCFSKNYILIKVNSVDVKVKQTADHICDGGTAEMEAQIGADYCIPILTSGCGFYDYITNVLSQP